MTLEAIWIGFAFMLGLIAKMIKLPPLVGYLCAGFLINMFIQFLGSDHDGYKILDHVSHLGVLLLLFNIGLKLNFKSLLKREVFGVGAIHFFVSTIIFFFIANIFFNTSLIKSFILGMTLAFSSTVLSAKVFEVKRELQAFHGRVAIGILILQDLMALIIISLFGNSAPSPWILLLLIIPLARPIIFKFIDLCGDDELFILVGLVLSLVIGGHFFEIVGLSPEIGAIALGLLVSKHKRSSELSRVLWSIKEFFLIGFFLKIGMSGLPSSNDWIFAIVCNLLLPIKGIIFFILLVKFNLRARSSFLASLSLTTFSEFALIVAALVFPEWLTMLALTVSISFIISAPLNNLSHQIFEKICPYPLKFEKNVFHPDEQPIDLGEAQVLIVGLGRTGIAAYNYLKDNLPVIGIDSDPFVVDKHKKNNLNVYYADVEDHLFWTQLKMEKLKFVVLAIGELEAKLKAVSKLRAKGFRGEIASYSLNDNEEKLLYDAGITHTYMTMTESGKSLAKFMLDKV